MTQRQRPSLFLVFGALALVGVASVFALQTEPAVVAIPSGMARLGDEFPLWADPKEAPLTDGTGRTITLDVTGEVALARADEAVALEAKHPTSALIGATHANEAVLALATLPAVLPKNRTIALVRHGVGEKATAPMRAKVTFPKEVDMVQAAVLSPDDKQIAWNVAVSRDAPGVGLLRRVFPGLADKFAPRRRWEVWLSQADGSSLHLVGAGPIEKGTRWHANPEGNFDLGWSRKTNRVVIAFEHQQRYVMPR